MRSPRFIAALLALLALAAPAQAQRISQLRTGDWLRVETLPGERTTGRLVALDGQELQIRSSRGPVAFSLAEVQRLEVSRGRQYNRGALIGAGVGLVSGILVGAVISGSASGAGGADLAVIGLPLVTLPAGILIGTVIAPHRYSDVERPYRP